MSESRDIWFVEFGRDVTLGRQALGEDFREFKQSGVDKRSREKMSQA